MSTLMVTKPASESPRTISLVATKPIPPSTKMQLSDSHPLLVVFVAALISLGLSMAMIGSIVIWISIRHSGVLAP